MDILSLLKCDGMDILSLLKCDGMDILSLLKCDGIDLDILSLLSFRWEAVSIFGLFWTDPIYI